MFNLRCSTLQAFHGGGSHLVELLDELAHEGGVGEPLAQLLATQEVVLVEDGATEVLDLTRHVPALVVGDALAHEAVEPFEYLRVVLQAIDDAIYGLRQHLGVADFHLQTCRETQFVGQATQDGLEECIDGLHAEAVVVMKYLVQRLAAAEAQLIVGIDVGTLFAQCLLERLEIGLAALQGVANTIELTEDAVLHLARGFIGERDSQDAGVFSGLLSHHEKLDVLYSQRECLA